MAKLNQNGGASKASSSRDSAETMNPSQQNQNQKTGGNSTEKSGNSGRAHEWVGNQSNQTQIKDEQKNPSTGQSTNQRGGNDRGGQAAHGDMSGNRSPQNRDQSQTGFRDLDNQSQPQSGMRQDQQKQEEGAKRASQREQ